MKLMEDGMTLAERQSLKPGKYFMDRLPYSREQHLDPSYGLLADAFGHPKPTMIAAEDDLMLRTTSLSKCGRIPSRVKEAEMKAKMSAHQKPLPRAEVDKGTPMTQYLHRQHKACRPAYTITNDRIADPSILLRDPKTAVINPYYYWRPSDVSLEMRDEFKRCDRSKVHSISGDHDLASAFE